MDFYTAFTAEVIKAGLFEGVSFPLFGKIQPKISKIQYGPEYASRPRPLKNKVPRK